MGVWELITRIVLSFFVLLALTRIMGRKEISQMTFFNLVSAISIGTIGGSLVINNELSIRNGVIALVGWAAITIIVGFIDINSKKVRKVIEGDPLIVIKNGQIMEKALRRTRLDVDALNAMLREKNAFSIKDVEYAIFETDGRLSVMKKDMKQPITASDMNISKPKNVYPIPTEVVSDGVINLENLRKLNLDTKWLEQKLSQGGIDSISEVFYAEVQKDGTLYIDSKNDVVH